MVIKADEVGRATQIIVENASKEISKEIASTLGNVTEQSLSVVNQNPVGRVIFDLSRGAASIESGKSVGSTAFKAATDYAEGDRICTGLCLVATGCELVAGTSVLIRYPGSLKVYIVAKTISAGCIKYRDLCKDARGRIVPCP
jgi:hypothetical protein